MWCTREKARVNKYRVDNVTDVEARKIHTFDASGLFREKRVERTLPYCTPDDFDNYVRIRGPGSRRPVPDGIFLTGLYAKDLRRWFDIFPRTQMLTTFNAHLKADAVGLFDTIQKFLGVPYLDYRMITYQTENGYTVIRGQETKAVKLFKPQYLPMSTWAKSILDSYYAEHNAQLFDLLGLATPGLGHAVRSWSLPAGAKATLLKLTSGS
jgi:hypothetical protein